MSAYGIPRDPSRDASDPGRSAWVAANAGAGKTYTLANRVTRLLLADVPPERILCLTFTKAAAAEMSRRLFDQLGRWAMLPDAELEQNIASIGGELRERGELHKARWLFAKALETPGGLKIQTIHAFCQNVLSRFPIEAGVPPFFRVLDDQTARELMAQARAHVLEAAGSGNTRLADAVAYLVTQTSDFRLEQILDAALSNDRRKLERFFAKVAQEDRASAIRVAHGIGSGDTPEGIAQNFCAGLHGDVDKLRAATEWLATGSKTDIERSANLSRTLSLSADSFSFFGESFLTGKGERYAKLATKKLSDARPDLLTFLEDVAERFCAAAEQHRGATAAKLAENALTLIEAVHREYGAAKRRRGALDYDDLIAETRNLLEKRAAAAWVLYKLDGGIDHLLIDEAQDTSPEQWAIVRKLTEEFFAGNALPENPRTIFAVGDEKQSIFSFQGADPAQFDINRQHFAAHVTAAEQIFDPVLLPMSRRSAPEILTFVDQVFSDEASREGLTSENAEIRHEALRADAKGLVEFWPSTKPAVTPEQDWWRPVDIPSENSAIARLAERLADQIKHWTRGDRYIPGHKKPITPGDIMILLPRREPFGSEIIRQLKARNIPVAGADRIRLNEQIAVMDLIALGRFAIQQDDELNLAALLRSPLIDMSEEELFSLAQPRSESLWSALVRHKDDFGKAHAFLSDVLARADFSAPYEFYSHFLVGLDLRKALLARLGAEAADAVEEFLSLAFAYERENTPSLEGFLHWIERGGAEIKRDMEQGRGEVRVMTVHGAKGLEADIVILPDTTSLPEQPSRKGHLLYTDQGILFPLGDAAAPQSVKLAKAASATETLKEHRRLLYVALTRAKERLYICGFENKKGINPQSWYAMTERAAQALGKEIIRGEESVLVFGESGDETGTLSFDPILKKTAIPEWALRAAPPEPPAPRLIRPSDAAGETPAMVSPVSQAQRFQRGVWIHALLAHLPELPEDKRLDAALRFLKSQKLASDEALALAADTLKVLNDQVFAPAFAPGSKAEIAIAADLPELGAGQRVHGRIDRLAVTEGDVLILDYKTNRPPPQTETDVPLLYLTQMALYRAAAAKIFPDKRIGCGLIWTDGPRLMPLSESVLNAQIERIRARLAVPGGNT